MSQRDQADPKPPEDDLVSDRGPAQPDAKEIAEADPRTPPPAAEASTWRKPPPKGSHDELGVERTDAEEDVDRQRMPQNGDGAYGESSDV